MTVLRWGPVAVRVSCALIMVVSVTTTGCSSDGDEVTIYPMLCDTALVGAECPGSRIPLNRSVFKVVVSRQEVLQWTPNILRGANAPNGLRGSQHEQLVLCFH